MYIMHPPLENASQVGCSMGGLGKQQGMARGGSPSWRSPCRWFGLTTKRADLNKGCFKVASFLNEQKAKVGTTPKNTFPREATA